MTFFTGTVRPAAAATSVAGYRAIGPGTNFVDGMLGRILGGNLYEFVSASMDADNGGTRLKPDSIGGGSPGRWHSIALGAASTWTQAVGYQHPANPTEPVVIGNSTAPVGTEKLRVVGNTRLEGQVLTTGQYIVDGGVGLEPADAGPVRIPKNTHLTARNRLNSGNVRLIGNVDTGSKNVLVVGGNLTDGKPDRMIAESLEDHTLRIAGTDRQVLTAAQLTVNVTTQHVLQVGGAARLTLTNTAADFSSVEVKTTGSFRCDGAAFIRVGTDPATAGAVRLTMANSIMAWDGAGNRMIMDSANFFGEMNVYYGVGFFAGNEFDVATLGANDRLSFRVDGVDRVQMFPTEILLGVDTIDFVITDMHLKRGSSDRIVALSNLNEYRVTGAGHQHVMYVAGAAMLRLSDTDMQLAVPLVQFNNTLSAAMIKVENSTPPSLDLIIRGQGAVAGGNSGRGVLIQGGRADTGGNRGRVAIQLNPTDTTMEEMVEVITLGGATPRRIVAIAFGQPLTATQMPNLTGDRVMFMANAATVPSANPVGGGIFYIEGGAAKYRSPNGTVTTFGPL